MDKSTAPILNEIWSLIKETQKNLKELALSQKETDRQIKTLSAETKEQIKTLSTETKEQIKTLFTSQKETDRQIKTLSAKTSAHIQAVGSGFNQRWGAFVESLVEGNIVRLFQDRGIDITESYTGLKVQWKKPNGNIQRREFDIFAANGPEAVLVEVKTSLTLKDVSDFLENLKNFKRYCPRYKLLTVYGAMAYLKSESQADRKAEQAGLFIIRATGDSANIVNGKDFKPKAFP